MHQGLRKMLRFRLLSTVLVMGITSGFLVCLPGNIGIGHARDFTTGFSDIVKKVQPALVEYMRYVDYRDVGLERLEAEKKTDKKMKEVEQKYGAQ